jgi:GMP synthase-like glutamine amidotransferase
MWMSHGDKVTKLPDGFVTIASTANSENAAVAHTERNIFGIQFHPEATPELIRSWLDVGGDHLDPDHSAEAVWDETQAAAVAMKANCMALVDWVIEALVKQ